MKEACISRHTATYFWSVQSFTYGFIIIYIRSPNDVFVVTNLLSSLHYISLEVCVQPEYFQSKLSGSHILNVIPYAACQSQLNYLGALKWSNHLFCSLLIFYCCSITVAPMSPGCSLLPAPPNPCSYIKLLSSTYL